MVKSATSSFSDRIVCSLSETVTDVPNAPYWCNFVKCKCKIQKQHNRPKAESNMLLGYPAMHTCNWKETAKIKLSSHAKLKSCKYINLIHRCNCTYRADVLAWLRLHLQAPQMRCFSGCKWLDTPNWGSILGCPENFGGWTPPTGVNNSLDVTSINMSCFFIIIKTVLISWNWTDQFVFT